MRGHEEARAEVYRDRINRGTGTDGFYSLRKLGAFGAGQTNSVFMDINNSRRNAFNCKLSSFFKLTAFIAMTS